MVVSDYAATVGKAKKHSWLSSYRDFSEVSKLIVRGKGEVLKFHLYERIKEKFKSIHAVMDTYLVKLIISRSVFKKKQKKNHHILLSPTESMRTVLVKDVTRDYLTESLKKKRKEK